MGFARRGARRLAGLPGPPTPDDLQAMKESTASSSILPTLLGVAFIVLKLCHVINWSWWWVLAPFWITFVVVAAATILILVWALRK